MDLLTGFLHAEQNSSSQVGHRTTYATMVTFLAVPPVEDEGVTGDITLIMDVVANDDDGWLLSTRHTVSHPALGHHVRCLSSSTSEIAESVSSHPSTDLLKQTH